MKSLLPILAIAAACSTQRDVTVVDASSSATLSRRSSAWRWGVTVDDVANVDAVVDALSALPARATARIVFDEGQPASYYVPATTAIHRVSDVMGELLDSQFMKDISVADYGARTREYLATVGANVDLWEVGNEINGEWLGADAMAKVSAAYEVVKAAHRPTALTLYYNQDCWEKPEHEMFRWTETNVPASVRQGIDVVLVSYYEDDCNGLRPSWPDVFARLGRLFPTASLGFGECGTENPSGKDSLLRRYYAIRLAEPRFIGGFFWWYFAEDMVPRTKPLWRTLASAMVTP